MDRFYLRQAIAAFADLFIWSKIEAILQMMN